ncbi:hypothetical protein C2G38_2178951 [Gigaspora rosea]|uniref:Uncharacterized protein n=1 Tax=Gigaspora rosea TaxID=44941 RepID=A0A397VEZ8_9GLOM|nr:hypothetical protein C2G38_2178951 [Gigaspora rosea]
MSEIIKCKECKATESSRFRPLKNEKWSQAERNGLTKVTWEEGIILCNLCYMSLVENPLQKLKKNTKRVKVSVEEAEDVVGNEVEAREEVLYHVETLMKDVEDVDTIYLIEVVETMARTFYEKEHVKKEGPIYSYDELRKVFQADKNLNNFLDQLYLVAKPLERGEKTMDRMKKLIVHICYLLASLNNSKINSFKFDIAFYLDSVGTSNEGLDTLAKLGVTTTSRAVDQKKKKVSDAHEEYVKNSLLKYPDNAFVLNVDDYHNIHVPQQSDSTSTSRPAHMATIIANPCPVSAIPRNGALNPKIIDDELIIKHLDEWFIINLGIPYNECKLGHTGNLKNVENYTNALRIVHNQELMQRYLSDHIIPVVADWPGQFFIRKAIVHRLLLNNEVIPSFVTSFVPIMGPLHVSLNGRELVYKKNSFLFNDIYKGIFGKKKNLGKKPHPWRIDLILYLMRVAWFDISNVIYSKFGHTCKNLEFLYLTDLLGNLIPLVLDVYAAHHREGNWLAYEEACMRCWCDLFLRFDRRNYKRSPLMFFSDIFFWMDTNHPMMNIVTNHLASLSDCFVETVHSIIRRRYLRDAIKSNVEAIKVSMMKDLGKKEFMDENVESADEDDSDAEDVTDDIAAIDNLLEQAKKNFFEL